MTFDESAVCEGCVCGHGPYSHASTGAYSLRLTRCDRCECTEYRLIRASKADDEFGITLDPCEHPSINGGVCAVCGATDAR